MDLLVSAAQTDVIPLIMAWWRRRVVVVAVMEVCNAVKAGVWKTNGRGLSLVIAETL